MCVIELRNLSQMYALLVVRLKSTLQHVALVLFVQTYKKVDQTKKAEELDKMKAKYGLSTPETAKK